MKNKGNILYSFLKVIYSILLKILFNPKVYGVENIPEGEGIILAGNHKCFIDPVVVMNSTKRRVYFMAKAEVFKGPIGWIFKRIGLIKVDRSKNNPLAVIEAEKILKNGEVLGIFPEGTRNKTDKEILRFRYGTVSIAKRANVKIVPFAIKGVYKVFRSNLQIEFGKPIDVINLEIEEANKLLENEVINLLRK